MGQIVFTLWAIPISECQGHDPIRGRGLAKRAANIVVDAVATTAPALTAWHNLLDGYGPFVDVSPIWIETHFCFPFLPKAGPLKGYIAESSISAPANFAEMLRGRALR